MKQLFRRLLALAVCIPLVLAAFPVLGSAALGVSISANKQWIAGLTTRYEYITEATYNAHSAGGANNPYWTSLSDGIRADGTRYAPLSLVRQNMLQVASAWYGQNVYFRLQGASGKGTVIRVPDYSQLPEQYKSNVRILSIYMGAAPRSANVGARKKEVAKRQIEEIKRSVRIEDYVRQQGYELQRHGSSSRHLHLAVHDSLVLDTEKPQEPVPLVLPEAEPKNWRRLYAYLLRERSLSKDVVRWLNENHSIYPDARGNLVYVSRNAAGEVEYAAKKGATSNNHFRSVVQGSNYAARAAWNMETKPTTVFVTEAAVDAWSIMTLFEKAGQDWRKYGYLSLECCCGDPLVKLLRENPQVQKVYLAQDADEAGLKSRAACRELLEKKGISGVTVLDKLPRGGKDWNEILKNQNETQWEVIEMPESGQQALRVEMQVAKFTAQTVKDAIKAVLAQRHAIRYGNQSMKALNRQGKQISAVAVNDSQLADIKKRLKEYGCDFSVVCENGRNHARSEKYRGRAECRGIAA